MKYIYINYGQWKIYIVAKSAVVSQGGEWEDWAQGYEIYNTIKDGEGHDITLTEHIRSISWSLHELDTSTPGIVYNTITIEWIGDHASEYTVFIVNGTAIVYRSEASTVRVEIVTPVNDPAPQQGLQQMFAPSPLSVEQVSQMAKAESANDVLAVIGHSIGRRA